jgi:hypothetical protein
MYKALVLTFPNIKAENARELVDLAQLRLKPEFVKLGLMLGEFHLFNNTPGLHNPQFYPLRTPHPSLAIRFMAPSDVVFLTGSAEQLKVYLREYKNNSLPSVKKFVQTAQDALFALEGELNKNNNNAPASKGESLSSQPVLPKVLPLSNESKLHNSLNEALSQNPDFFTTYRSL